MTEVQNCRNGGLQAHRRLRDQLEDVENRSAKSPVMGEECIQCPAVLLGYWRYGERVISGGEKRCPKEIRQNRQLN